MDIFERFKKYIAYDTMSSETSGTHPSSINEIAFSKILVQDLKEMGITDVFATEHAYVYAHINNGSKSTICLISHMDTAPTIRGDIKNPRLIKNYDGSVIELNKEFSLNPSVFSTLNEVIGDDIIVTDGEHLLGGDDKAGIAIIFEFLKYYIDHKDEFNSNLSICFTPDEEIGEGPMFFETEKAKADVAYTLDGESVYEANFENFNACSAKISIEGVGVHPGSAKDVMVNAALIAAEFNSLLPKDMVPSKTSGHEGFIHLCSINGDVEKASLEYILRDHDMNLLLEKKDILNKTKEKIMLSYPKCKINITFKDEYKNMNPYFIKNPLAIKIINASYLNTKTKIKYTPIRGGTDGATITYMGLPCPNLGTGDYNPHGRFEFVSLTQMKKMVEILKEIFKYKF